MRIAFAVLILVSELGLAARGVPQALYPRAGGRQHPRQQVNPYEPHAGYRPAFRLPTPLRDIERATQELMGFSSKAEKTNFLQPILDAVIGAQTILSKRDHAPEAKDEALMAIVEAVENADDFLRKDLAEKGRAYAIVADLLRATEALRLDLTPEEAPLQRPETEPAPMKKQTLHPQSPAQSPV